MKKMMQIEFFTFIDLFDLIDFDWKLTKINLVYF